MKILKFGGSSVANPERIKGVIDIVRGRYSESENLVVVVSAQAGVTDMLLTLCGDDRVDQAEAEKTIRQLEKRHMESVKELITVSDQPACLAEIMSMSNELSDIVRGASLVGEVTPRTRDLVLSFGERLSAYLFSNALRMVIPGAKYSDARDYILTDSSFGHARVNFELTNRLVRDYFSGFEGLPVVTGFIGSTPSAQTTTLGRSGSDYTASIIGAALNAEIIEIWSDANGVMTADPRYVPEARSIAQLSYSEAMELSHFGAKILFPASIQPAMEKEIPVLVKNTFNPEHHGTLISCETSRDNGFIKGITSLRDISIINVEGSGMVGVAGISSRLFSALSANEISVILISQASSEHSICLAIMTRDAEKACNLLRSAFADELASGHISSIYPENELAIVAVVGENMRHMPGVAARVFSPMGRNGINIKAISQGSSELNISFIIHANDLGKALRILHQSLFNIETRRLNLYVAGTGMVGSRLLDMISTNHEFLNQQKIDIRIAGLINSRKMISGRECIDPATWKQSMENNGRESDFGEFVKNIMVQNIENSVFVDITAAQQPVEFYERLLEGSIAIVAANKRANTLPFEEYIKLHSAARKRNVPFHFETNVGGGLPVINTIRKLISGGDTILRIEAVLSGTLNWLLSEYDGNTPFSELVMTARERGYTEPDPRDDLSGLDVARKSLILAREAGTDMELEEISIEALMPPDAANVSGLSELYIILKEYDRPFSDRYASARAEGKKLRYMAIIENGTAKVALTAVDDSHPFFGLRGSENCIILTTEYYKQYPMVIKGPGAGVNVTAAGLLADIVRIAEGIRM